MKTRPVCLMVLAFALAAPVYAGRHATPVSPASSDDADGDAPASGQCGVERWAVKTLSDPDASAVNVASPIDATIGELVTNPAPSPWSSGQQVPDQRTLSGPYSETGVYAVRGVIIGYKREADHDFHVIIENADPGAPPHQTMIVESPTLNAPAPPPRRTFPSSGR